MNQMTSPWQLPEGLGEAASETGGGEDEYWICWAKVFALFLESMAQSGLQHKNVWVSNVCKNFENMIILTTFSLWVWAVISAKFANKNSHEITFLWCFSYFAI